MQEPPQAVGRDTDPADFVSQPNTGGASTAWASVAVAAKDTPSAKGFSLGAAVVKAKERAMPNEGADDVAVWAGRQLEPLEERLAFLVVMAKPSHIAHVRHPLESLIAWYQPGEERGRARYDRNLKKGSEVPGYTANPGKPFTKFWL